MVLAWLKAFLQLDDPALRRVMWRGFGMAVGLFAVLLALAWWGLGGLTLFDITWLDTVIAGLGGLAAFVIAWLLFPGAVIALQGLLLEDAAAVVERSHYPTVAARSAPLATSLWAASRLAVLSILLNLLALPLYFIPGLNLLVFYSLNGYLLGREYFELVALRRMDAEAAREMRKRHSGKLFIAGVTIAGVLSIPVIGWFMPAVAAAFMVHRFESLRGNRPGV